MKTLLISGSPRKGNTEYLLNSISKTMDDSQVILLRNHNMSHCKGCLTCHNDFKCILKDDTEDILDKMIEVDFIIFGIPNYFDNVTSLFKTFIDRCHPLYKSEQLKNKKVFFLFVGGGKVEGTACCMNNAIEGFVKYLKLDVLGTKSFKALHPFDIQNVVDVQKLSAEIISHLYINN